MPVPAVTASVRSIRNDVSSWGCKERKARVAKAKGGKRTAKAKKAPAAVEKVQANAADPKTQLKGTVQAQQ
jgi:hypothetical protein